jgi:hypothetical protein
VIRRIAAASAAALTVAWLVPVTALAAPGASAAQRADGRLATVLSLSMPAAVPAGRNLTVVATLTSDGQPVPDALLQLQLNGAKHEDKRTGPDGVARFLLIGDMRAGVYPVTVIFHAGHTRYARATASGSFEVTADDLALDIPGPTPEGQRLTVVATLISNGQPLRGIDLRLFVNGVQRREARTDVSGTAHFGLAGDLQAGTYKVFVSYLGPRRQNNLSRHTRATASGTLVIVSDGLTLDVPAPFTVGQKVTLAAHLSSAGVPIAGESLHLLLNGVERKQERTDATGTARFVLKNGLEAGTYNATVSYFARHRKGTLTRVELVSASAVLTVLHLEVVVHTVPVIAGVTFTIDNHPFTSDAAGDARVIVLTPGAHTLAIVLPASTATTKFEFARWSDNSFAPSRIVHVFQNVHLDAGLQIEHLTNLRFVDLHGHQLDPARVTNLVLWGPNADVVTAQYPYPPVWLKTPIPSKGTGQTGLYIPDARYSVISASLDHLSVVDQGAQRYTPGATGGTWTIPLRLYTLQIQAKDAITGTAFDRPAVVTNPTGHIQVIQLNSLGKASFTAGHGLYTVHVLASGFSPLAPVALSKDQAVVIPIISPMDIAIILGINVGVLLALFIASRRRRWLATTAARVLRRP